MSDVKIDLYKNYSKRRASEDIARICMDALHRYENHIDLDLDMNNERDKLLKMRRAIVDAMESHLHVFSVENTISARELAFARDNEGALSHTRRASALSIGDSIFKSGKIYLQEYETAYEKILQASVVVFHIGEL